jgi:hypothetical protein
VWIKFALPVVLGMSPLSATPSKGMLEMFVYLCNPDGLTEKMVAACTAKFPELSEKGRTALESWRKRNATHVPRAVQECDPEAIGLSMAEVKVFREGMKKMEADWLESQTRELTSSGIFRCERVLQEIATTYDLARLLPPKQD